jgi:hypothetical protein
VSDAFAKKWFPPKIRIGKRIRVNWQGTKFPMEIVGVVGDVRYSALETEAAPMLYGFYRQPPWRRLELAGSRGARANRTACIPDRVRPDIDHQWDIRLASGHDRD